MQLPELDTACPDCQGNGIVTTPGWLAWDEHAREFRRQWEQANPGGSWYSSAEGRAVEDGYPDEAECMCPECDGAGRKITPAGRVLLAFMRTHWRAGR